jgi:hypothetical protein
VYNLDSRILAAIKSERGVVEPASERKREEVASAPPRRSAPPPVRNTSTSFFQSPFFGAPSYARQTSPRAVYR